MQNMPQLQRLDCSESALRVEGVRALQPSLQANRTLKELSLWGCEIGNEGISVLADSLAGNTTIDILKIGYNEITSNVLDDITRLLESTHLCKVDLAVGS
jgi:Ran GTPase-activating protein (RanGAP) involved in mRNA processing and transport